MTLLSAASLNIITGISKKENGTDKDQVVVTSGGGGDTKFLKVLRVTLHAFNNDWCSKYVF